MTELDPVRLALVDPDRLVRAVASGRRRGESPAWRRVELRYVDLKAGRQLQVTAYDDAQAHTDNHAAGEPVQQAVAELLGEPFGNWHVETTTETLQVRVTKKGRVFAHTTPRAAPVEIDRSHDREKARMLEEGDPVFVALGLADRDGRIKPSRRSKFRQVEDFLRILDTTISEAMAAGHLRTPSAEDPLRVVDLGCGNAYLTLAAHRFLTGSRDLPIRVIGVDRRAQALWSDPAVEAAVGATTEFVPGTIADVRLDPAPDVVLALHACDTATDDALARAVEWDSSVVLAAPCCHHDIAAQLRTVTPPAPYSALVRDGILRERFADTITDAVRAELLRERGFRVDVMEFVDSRHTPRNTLLRAVQTGSRRPSGEYADLVAAWGLRPKLAELLDA